MATSRWQLVKQIFDDVLDAPEPERICLLNSACGEDESLRAEVEALLSAHEEAGEFLSSPTKGVTSDDLVPNESDFFERLQRALAGRYSLELELGRGGMGVVYLARDVALDRRVAIKLLPPSKAAIPEHRNRFLREARTAAGLSHPNIVPIHLVEEVDKLVYFVMAYIDGESLGERVRRAGPLRSEEAAKLVQEVAWALGYAHSHGVIHRDIKPDNILIDSGSGRALVSDFGIARLTDPNAANEQGQVFGTRQYMSPEQASGEAEVDGRADLYSLGVTAFFALTGRLPFESEDPTTLTSMLLTEPAPPIKSVSQFVPARLAESIDRCLSKDPDARFGDGGELAEAIADAQLTRREIAPSVREFLSAAKFGVVQATALAMLWMFLGISGMADSGMFGVIMMVTLMAVTPLVLVHPVLVARGVVRAGFEEHDVAEAAASSSTSLDANIEYEVARAEYLANWFSKLWIRPIFLAAGLFHLIYLPDFVGQLLRAGISLEGLGILFFFTVIGTFGTFAAGMAIAPKQIVAILTRGTPENAGILHKIWSGPIGRWFFKLAGIGLKKTRRLPVTESHATEVLIGNATTLLFEQLPKTMQERLGSVPDVIENLQRMATVLRKRRNEMVQALADAGSQHGSTKRQQFIVELETARDKIDDRLATAMAAMDNLRLDLLRMSAGVGRPEDLTAAIQEARSVGEAVDAEIEGQKEVETGIKARE